MATTAELATNFKVGKLKSENLKFSFSKMSEFHSFLQEHGLGHPLCAGLCVRRALSVQGALTFSGTRLSTFNVVVRTVDFV